MKQRSTTPVSKGLAAKATFVAAAVLMAVGGSVPLYQAAFADDFDRKIQQKQSEINSFNSSISNLVAMGESLQEEIDRFNQKIAVIQKKIDDNQKKYNKLTKEIEITEQKIEDNKNALGQTLADMYVAGDVSPLEMLASSSNIAEFVDQQEYRQSIQESIQSTIGEIENLKVELEAQKKDLGQILKQQKASRQDLASQKSQKDSLLAETKGKESNYRKLVSKTQKEKAELQRQQQEAIAAAYRNSNGGNAVVVPGDPNKGGYPWEGHGCWVSPYDLLSRGGINGNGTDPLGYGCRQCASYTAWRVLQKTGMSMDNFPNFGDARNWAINAEAYGYKTGSTPRKDSVGVMYDGPFGHVVWVESVNSDGTINISQYNANINGIGYGQYTEAYNVSPSTYNRYVYF